LNKFFRLIGFGLLFVMLSLIILGNYSSQDIQISQTHHLQAPMPLIWQHITNEEKISDWIKLIPIQYCVSDTNNVITCFADNNEKIKISTGLKFQERNSINMILEETWHNPYIKDYSLKVHLKSLRDGTTEINFKLQYHLKSIMAKVLNKLYYEGYQKSLIDKNVESLQKHFGRV